MFWRRCELVDETGSARITVDVMVDVDGRVVEPYRYHGEWAHLTSSETYPLVFIRDSHLVDLGSAERINRYNHIELHGARILEGDTLYYYEGGDKSGSRWEFVVTSVRDLAAHARAGASTAPLR